MPDKGPNIFDMMLSGASEKTLDFFEWVVVTPVLVVFWVSLGWLFYLVVRTLITSRTREPCPPLTAEQKRLCDAIKFGDLLAPFIDLFLTLVAWTAGFACGWALGNQLFRDDRDKR